jgi:Flp pilus assembly protein TadD
VAPFSLIEYREVKAHARQIVDVTSRRYMPPWLPAPGKGEFVEERRLSDAQIGLLRRWVEAGMLEGDPALLPARPRLTPGWSLGPPDLVLETARPLALPPDGTDVFWNLVYPSPTDRPRYVRAMEIRLGDPKVGHHANLLVDRSGTAVSRDAATPEAGFPGIDVSFEAEGFDPDSHFLFWKPGSAPYEELPGMAWRLDPRTDLVLNLHLRPSGKPERVAPRIGLYFTEESPRLRPMLLQLEHDGAIDLPPGARDVVVEDELVLPVAVDVLAVYPHAHYLGKDIRGEAILPDGTRQWLIHIPDWDVNWQGVYRLAKPLALPKGTRLTMRWSFDNSAENVRNPSQPPRRVRTGNRAEDEMAHLWLQVLPRTEPGSPDPRLPLQEALMRRRLVKYPADFAAHYNLGGVLQTQGRLEEALRELEEAVRLEPRRAAARTALGTALQASGRTGEALREYREALRLDPGYANAHFDLAQALRANGRTKEAIPHYREAVRLRGDDAEIRAQLGGALQQAGLLEEAVLQDRAALALDPLHANARFNLAQALAAQGRLEEARIEFEAAIEKRPDDPDLRNGLGLVLAALGRGSEALAQFRETLVRRGSDLVAHDGLGQLLLATGAAAEAVPHLRVVVEGRPQDADAWNNLGSGLAMTGDLTAAAAAFERALAIDPQHSAARSNLARARPRQP